MVRIVKRRSMREDEIRSIVAETLVERCRLQQESIDMIVVKRVASVLATFGVEDEDRRELRADFQHLRRWRKSVEQVQSYTFKAIVTMLIAGLIGAAWLGLRVMLDK